MVQIFAFVELYVAPFIIALGFIQLFKGIVNYFLIGPSFEEDRKQIGRQALLWAFVFFFAGFVVYSFAHWLLGIPERWQNQDRTDFEIREQQDLLKVPNVPGIE